MIDHLPRRVSSPHDVLATIEAMARLALAEGHEFAATIAGLALHPDSRDQLERNVTSIYALGLEDGHPFLPDLADGVLQWLEDANDADVAEIVNGAVPTKA